MNADLIPQNSCANISKFVSWQLIPFMQLWKKLPKRVTGLTSSDVLFVKIGWLMQPVCMTRRPNEVKVILQKAALLPKS